jgi:O-antigen/teichoic acid export membrane protein
VLGQALRSYARPSQSMLLLFAAAPLASIVIIGVCLQQGVRLVWQVLAAANLAGLCIAMLTALCLCLHARPGAKAGVAPGPRVRMPRLADLTGQYYASLLTVAFVALPSFVLPVLVSVGEIGLFYVALRITTLLASVLDAVAGIYAPRVAACFSVGDLAGVREEFRRSLRITRLSGVVLGMVLLGLAPQLLALFGEQYRDAAELLRLQMLGRVVQLFTGITSNVLWMIGQPLLEGSLSIAAAGLTIFCAGLSFATPAVVVSVAVSLGHAFKNGAQFFLLQRIFRRLPRARQQ